ncbi:SMP-30/gluconolactonase/LRE family protein [Microbacterium sp. H1-D42]|uniref:SMP-30/gluconolactonase/LRE family protein n=1 Tax=Microbacterium sp. H1-D42 TaxID=2925844 RepID=UPI001F53DCD7|nr:SMP-30/gluconolactonase/LRE family protein [Microbacterium sp. H1-D42]UNK70448.1 SMP-30/gluconolactonase/LRE family protein [Microbacterium sp. H1-D42]
MSENANAVVNPRVVVSRRAICGEGPYWDTVSDTVVWVDIVGKQVLRTTIGAETTVVDYPEMVGAAAPRENGGLVLAVESGFAVLDADGAVTHRFDILSDIVRMNDAKVDPAGRYWAGSCAMDFAAGKGGLWRLDEDLHAELILPGLTQPNGIGWSPDGTTMYLAETQDRVILRFDFDPSSSTITSEPTVFAKDFPGYPDGLCVDADGHLWLAEFGTGTVYELDTEGAVLHTIRIPTAQPTSCAFVGPDLRTLWVTSAADGQDDDPHAGSVFEIADHGATGLPVALFRG